MINLKDACFQIPIYPDSRLYLWIAFLGKVYQFKEVFQPFDSTSGLHQGIHSDPRVGTPAGNSTPALSGRLVGDHSQFLSCNTGSNSSSSVRTWGLSSIRRNWILIDTMQKGVFLADSQIVRFRDLADKFLFLLSPLVKMWQKLLGHMTSLEWFVPRGHIKHLSDQD